MIVTELRLLIFVLTVFLLTTPTILVDAAAGRCYLCSQNTLAECAGNAQLDSSLYPTVLQYYTEPCNGQCILFRNENTSTVRGCSWTYGHMTSKSTGWHELSPGIQAYFCDSYLCNNGTYEKPDTPMIRIGTINNELLIIPQQTLSPQQLFILAGNTPPSMINTDQHLPPIDTESRQLRQCYSCTARLTGCGEHLDPQYVSKYIRPCTSSCIIFRNPSDHHLITRDCSTSWPQVHTKSGLHKLLGSDAFFCQESLCNGISFDFIMGIFHNQLPAVITFPLTPAIEDLSTTTIHTTTTTATLPITTTSDIHDEEENEDDNVVWEDPELDFVLVEPAITAVSIITTTLPLSTELPDDTEVIYESTTIPVQPAEHFDFIENNPSSSTISGGVAVAEQDSPFNWWDLDEVSFASATGTTTASLTTTTTVATNTLTIIPSTIKLTNIEEDEWEVFNTSTIPSVTRFDHLSNSELDFDMNDYFQFPTTSTINLINNSTSPFVPYYFTDYKNKEEFSGLIKPIPTLAMPPFSWMLNLANQPKNKRQNIINTNFATTTMKNKKKRVNSKTMLNENFDHFYESCNKKQCQHGGRLNADCLCICLPAFTGNNCEIVHCNNEPAHICDFVLVHECKSEYVRYLCPKFCQMNICSSKKLS